MNMIGKGQKIGDCNNMIMIYCQSHQMIGL